MSTLEQINRLNAKKLGSVGVTKYVEGLERKLETAERDRLSEIRIKGNAAAVLQQLTDKGINEGSKVRITIKGVTTEVELGPYNENTRYFSLIGGKGRTRISIIRLRDLLMGENPKE